jgi:hypothetical protein
MFFRRKVIYVVDRRPRLSGVKLLAILAVILGFLAAAPELLNALLMDMGFR